MPTLSAASAPSLPGAQVSPTPPIASGVRRPMTPQEKRQASVDQYLAQALAARAAAAAASLDQVRRKHELAAARWDELAAMVVREGAAHDARRASAPVRPSGAGEAMTQA